jgi:hypothetical protein
MHEIDQLVNILYNRLLAVLLSLFLFFDEPFET